MQFLVLSGIIILIIISIFHFYWVLGGTIGLGKSLPMTREGKLFFRPSKLATLFVGIIIVCFAYVAFRLYFDSKDVVYSYLAWAIACIFFLRSIGEFNTVGFFKKIKNTSFAKYDTLFYSPLCLYFAIMYAFLAYRV